MNPVQDTEALRIRRAAAGNPSRAAIPDSAELAKLFAAAFLNDPVFDWIARSGARRAAGAERFFGWLLSVRAIPYGEVWMGGGAAAIWLPPGAPATAGGLLEQLALLPMFLDLCGVSRLVRGQAMADAMQQHHPHTDHFYLAFIAVAPEWQGNGLGAALLEATLRRVDVARMPAYLENSNPKNDNLYLRQGFAMQSDIAPRGAPSLRAMWRSARTA